MTKYKIKFSGKREFIIISPGILLSLIREVQKSVKKEISVDVEQLMPESYQQYILNVINVNRDNPYFAFDYICENPVRKKELFQILRKQLGRVRLENKGCFDEIRLIEKRGKWFELECAEPFWIACKDVEGIFLYCHSDGRQEVLIIEY